MNEEKIFLEKLDELLTRLPPCGRYRKKYEMFGFEQTKDFDDDGVRKLTDFMRENREKLAKYDLTSLRGKWTKNPPY